MASSFPSSVDSFPDPLVNSPLNSPSHAALHTDVNDAVEKLETKVGIGASPAASALSGARLIANGAGSSSWQRDGVCTSSTRPASPYSGQEIYETDTNLKYVWNGSAWYLIGGGTAVANAGLVFIKEGSATSGGSLPVDGCFTSMFDNYRLVIEPFQPATNGGVVLRLRLRVGGVDAQAAEYSTGLTGLYADGSSSNTAQSGGTSLDTGMFNSTNTLALGSSTMDIIRPAKAERTHFIINSILYASNWGGRAGFGEHNLTTAYDGFTLLPSIGNFTAIKYKLYGYRQA